MGRGIYKHKLNQGFQKGIDNPSYGGLSDIQIENISKGLKKAVKEGRHNGAWKKGHIPSNKGQTSINPIMFKAYSIFVKSAYWKNLRNKVIDRDKLCIKCRDKGNNVDHIIPWRISLDNSLGNLQLLCKSCNSKKVKGDRIKYG